MEPKGGLFRANRIYKKKKRKETKIGSISCYALNAHYMEMFLNKILCPLSSSGFD